MASWPASLPQHQFVGLTVQYEPNVLEFEVDAGPAKRRRRSSKTRVYVRTDMELTGAQMAVFAEFFETTLVSGTLAFDWAHPVTDAAASFRFSRRPSWTLVVPAVDTDERCYQGTLDLEIL